MRDSTSICDGSYRTAQFAHRAELVNLEPTRGTVDKRTLAGGCWQMFGISIEA